MQYKLLVVDGLDTNLSSLGVSSLSIEEYKCTNVLMYYTLEYLNINTEKMIKNSSPITYDLDYVILAIRQRMWTHQMLKICTINVK